MLVYILNAYFDITAAAYTQAGRQTGQFASVQFSWPAIRSGAPGERSLGGVGVTGVQAGLHGCRGAAIGGSWRAVEGVRAPPQVLQRLQEGATRSLLLQG